ncbi:FMN-binding protein [Natranaerobius trueperi]|uniref:FMN-binding protein n=1 Tax=Natranaerobius trueperi TaxID=759412 RepID=UPI0013034E60|nr:FMN-binding protein [Natranaerobius trueperi]
MKTTNLDNLEVEVEVSGDEVLNVEIVEHNESDGISDEAFNQIPERIVEEQSTEVDSVSGATDSSVGIKEAAQDALD